MFPHLLIFLFVFSCVLRGLWMAALWSLHWVRTYRSILHGMNPTHAGATLMRHWLIWTLLREALLQSLFIHPLAVVSRILRTQRPYTLREKALLLLLEALLAGVEIGILFPARFLGLPGRWHQWLVRWCWGPLREWFGTIECSAHIMEWLSQEEEPQDGYPVDRSRSGMA